MSDTLTYARSTADKPRQYQPYNYYDPNRTISFDWDLEPVGEGVPVVTLSVSHTKNRKCFDVYLYTSVKDGNSRLTRFSFRGEKWADLRVDLDRVAAARFSRKKLEEVAALWLAEVQANPESFAEFFVTDETAVRS